MHTGRRKRFTGKEIPAIVIGDGERITVFLVSGLKLSFKVDTPNLIGVVTGSKLMGWNTSFESARM